LPVLLRQSDQPLRARRPGWWIAAPWCAERTRFAPARSRFPKFLFRQPAWSSPADSRLGAALLFRFV